MKRWPISKAKAVDAAPLPGLLQNLAPGYFTNLCEETTVSAAVNPYVFERMLEENGYSQWIRIEPETKMLALSFRQAA